jgi:hypothetical protein
MKPALFFAAIIFMLHSANLLAQQLQKPSQPLVSVSAEQLQQQRIAYAAMIEKRFNEIAEHVGGIDALVQTNNIEAARRKAAKDIEMFFGPPPSLETELQRIQLEQAKLALEGTKLALEAASYGQRFLHHR